MHQKLVAMKTILIAFAGSFCLLISTILSAQIHSTDFNDEISELVKKAQIKQAPPKTVADSTEYYTNRNWSNDALNTGFLLAYRQQYQEAIRNYEAGCKRELLAGRSEQDPGFVPHYATMATCYLNVGNLMAAEAYLNKCLQLEQLFPKINLQVYSVLRSNLATLHFYRGRIDLALPLLQDVRQQLQGRQPDLDYFMVLFNLARVYGEIDQVELAEYLFEQCATVLDSLYIKPGKEHRALFMGLSNIQSRVGKHAESIQNSRNAMSLAAKNTSLEYTRTCASLGLGFRNLNEADSALVYLLQAEKGYDSLGLQPQEYPRLMEGLGLAFALKNNSEKAEQYFNAGIQAAEGSDAHAIRIRSSYSRFLLKNGRTSLAAVQLQEMLHRMPQMLDRATATLSEQGKVRYAEQLNSELNTALSFALDYGRQYPEVRQAVVEAVLQLRGSSLRSTRASYAAIRASGDAALLEKYERWKGIREILHFQYQKTKTERTLQATILDSISLEADLLETQLMAASVEFQQERQKVDASMIQAALQPGEAAIQFVRFQYATAGRLTDSAYYVANLFGGQADTSELIFLCTEKALSRRLGLGNTGSPENRITAIYKPTTKKYGKTVIPSLYDLVWEKLESRLKGIQKVWIAPDGLLNQLAFEAIRKSPDLPEIGRLRKINYLASVADLLTLNACYTKEISTAALFGNMQYKTDVAQMQKHLPGRSLAPKTSCAAELKQVPPDWALAAIANADARSKPGDTRNAVRPLPYTKQEIERAQGILRQHFATICAFQNYEALEEYFKALGQGSPSPAIIHIATHGEYQVDDPNAYSALDKAVLLFAGSDSLWRFKKRIPGMEDQILQAAEVCIQNLSNTKLVILSACKSGLGDIRNSEGVFGFQRAFRLAGADHLIISLWAVSDRHTAAFFEAFYQHWFSGLEIREAFDKTQEEMQAKYPAVYHWAAFVLY
jgi:hypothetical protein